MITLINNHFSFTGVVVRLYTEHHFENNLQIFEIEIEMQDCKTIILPVLYGEFTKGTEELKRGDKILVEGAIDLIEKKVSCVASYISNLSRYARKNK